MTDLLSHFKKTVKKTPLWPVLRPRRIHAYNLGMGRTGTTAMASIFASFRTAHEPMGKETISVLERYWKEELPEQDVRAFLRKRDRVHRFEFESTPFLGPFATQLAQLFPEAKFLLTVREPYTWLRSAIDKCVNTPRTEHPSHVVKLRDLCYGVLPKTHPEQEQALERYNLHTLGGFLQYWGWHNQTVLNNIPDHRLLLIPTSTLNEAISQVGDFVGVDSEALARPGRQNQSSTRNGILAEVEEKYVRECIEKHCGKALEQVNEKLKAQGFEPFSI